MSNKAKNYRKIWNVEDEDETEEKKKQNLRDDHEQEDDSHSVLTASLA